MKKIYPFVFVLLLFSFGCIQQTSNASRQFDKQVRPQALLKDGENIELSLRYWYQFSSKTEEPFDELGYFIEEDHNIHRIVQSIVYASVREIIKKYKSKELSETDINVLEEELYAVSKRNASALENPLKIQFNSLLFGEIEYPHNIQKAIKANLLEEYDALKSTDAEVRIQAIKKLLIEGSEHSYAIILDHWSKEKNEKVRSYILESMVRKD